MNIDTTLKQAQAAYQSEDFERAVQLYDQILNVEGSHEEALFMRAMIAQAREDWDTAAEYMRRTLNANPGNATHHYTFGHIQMRRGDFDRAYAGFSKAVELDPNYLPAHASLGYTELRRGNWTAAEKQLRLALKVEQDNPQLLVYLGMALIEQGKTEKAISYLEHACKLAPAQGLPQYHLGRAMLVNGQAAFAIQCFENALEKLPKIAADVLLQRGRAEEATGQMDKAVKTYHQALEAPGRSPGAVAALARLYRLAGHLEAAEQVLRDHPVPRGQFDEVETEWAEVLLAQGRAADAARRLQPLPDSASRGLRVVLARALYACDELEAALSALAPDTDEGRKHIITQTLHARILHAQNKPAAAEKILDRLLEEDPKPLDAVLLRAERLMSTAQAEDAIALLKSARRRGDLHPVQNRAVLRALGDAYYRAGDQDLALSTWKEQLPVPSILEQLDETPLPAWTYKDPDFSETAESAMSTAAVSAWSRLEQPRRAVAPIFIYGWPGTGRHRLLRALSGHPGLHAIRDSLQQQLSRRQLITTPRGAVALGQIDQQALATTHRRYRQLLLAAGTSWDPDQQVLDAMVLEAAGLPAISRYFPGASVICLNFDEERLALAWQRLGAEVNDELQTRIARERSQLEQCKESLDLGFLEFEPGQLESEPAEVLQSLYSACGLSDSKKPLKILSRARPMLIRQKANGD